MEQESKQKRSKGKIEHWKIVTFYLVCYDIVAINAAYFLGLLIRFDFSFNAIPKEFLFSFFVFAPFYTVLTIVIYARLHLYNSLWKFAGFSELNRLAVAALVTTALQVIGMALFVHHMPVSYFIFGALLQFCLTVAVRFAYRYITLERNRRANSVKCKSNAMIIGAGSAGQMLIKEMKGSAKIDTVPRCVIDDDSNKWGRTVEGLPVVGGRDDILAAAEKYEIDQIFFAIPSASASERRDILNICKETSCELKSLPGIYQLVNGEVCLNNLKAVAVEDLLGRDPIQVNMEEIFQHLKGKVILVTGGGGSIGSELCRQIAGHEPKQLIIFDIYENNAYEIEQELKRKYPELNLVILIGSVRDSRRINSVFKQYHLNIVYHAAAHKHVPLMEGSPNEAIKNNVIGTYKTAYAALMTGTERFVLISTDKAVNPTNIMGASKRLCEMVIQSMDAISRSGRTEWLPFLAMHKEKLRRSMHDPMDCFETDAVSGGELTTRTQYVAVRFGNVLGSNGSVVPLFKKQIELGGPVTVTHPEITRYFMTIPEAVSLVLQAGTYAHGGEIFVLDMGEPVKIDTLARNVIKLSGYTPDVDIKIVYTGLRPGEKLFEEKLMAEEGLEKTANKLIHIGKPIPFDVRSFLASLEDLAVASYDNCDAIVDLVASIVPTYHPDRAVSPIKPTSEKADMPELELELASVPG
ncbi:MAG: polysaccharide biosynthesis protein [Oscillospiraceae bacterium]|nr:polysaccharide biosynthesis protein [Oscillospiraceae bacterium]